MCRIVVLLFIISYLTACFLFAVGTFGWFSQDRDPLSGIFLLPLGLPWNLFSAENSDWLGPWLGVLAPLVNLGILATICQRLNRH